MSKTTGQRTIDLNPVSRRLDRGSRIRRGKVLSLILIFCLSVALSGWTLNTRTVQIPIFGFHDIVNPENPEDLPPQRPRLDMDYYQQDFANFLDYLGRENYWLISAQDLLIYFIEKTQPIPLKHLGEKPVMITFDDGYKGVHKYGLPILKLVNQVYETQGKFVLFINPRYLGVPGNEEILDHLTEADLIEGFSQGLYDVQSHGYSHHDLTKLREPDLNFELAKSKNILRSILEDVDRNKVTGAHVAYPYGAMNRKIEKVLPKYHLTGFLYNDRVLRVNSSTRRYRLSRIAVSKKRTVQDLIRLAKQATTLQKRK